MNKTKSPARKLVKYLIALPLALLLMAGNSVYAQNQRESEIFTEVEKYPELRFCQILAILKLDEDRIYEESSDTLKKIVKEWGDI